MHNFFQKLRRINQKKKSTTNLQLCNDRPQKIFSKNLLCWDVYSLNITATKQHVINSCCWCNLYFTVLIVEEMFSGKIGWADETMSPRDHFHSTCVFHHFWLSVPPWIVVTRVLSSCLYLCIHCVFLGFSVSVVILGVELWFVLFLDLGFSGTFFILTFWALPASPPCKSCVLC